MTDAERLLGTAQAALDTGDLESAAETFQHALDASLPDDRCTAFQATIGLVTANGRAGRFFEALVLSRRAVSMARTAGRPDDLARALGGLCVGLINTGGEARIEGPLAELEALLALHDGAIDVAAHRMALTVRFAQAVKAGDASRARGVLEQMRARLETRPLAKGEAQMLDDFEARIRVVEGELDSADRHFGNALRKPDRSLERLDVLYRRAHALADIQDLDRAREAAAAALELLDARRADAFRMETQADLGARLGVFFQERLDDPEAARASFAIASTALAARLAQVDRSVSELLGGSDQDADQDAAFLRDIRTDFEQAQLHLLANVVRNLDLLRERGRSILIEETRESTFVSLCAWCRRVHLPGGHWVDLGRFTPEPEETVISHGMCRTCYARVDADELSVLGIPPATGPEASGTSPE